jgi:hypothetical protein
MNRLARAMAVASLFVMMGAMAGCQEAKGPDAMALPADQRPLKPNDPPRGDRMMPQQGSQPAGGAASMGGAGGAAGGAPNSGMAR